MNANFFSNTPRALSSRALWFSAVCLLCLSEWICISLAQAPKEPSATAKAEVRAGKSAIDPARVAANSPWPDLRNLLYRGDFAFDEQEALEIKAIYAAAQDALRAIQPGPTAGVQQRAVKLQWAADMEAFLDAHTNSAWGPGIALTLGNVSRDRLAYSKAAEMFARAWDHSKDASDGRTLQIAGQAGRELAGILAMTGQLELFDDLVSDAKSKVGEQSVRDWW